MRVVLVEGCCAPGTCGVGDYAGRLSAALARSGVHVEVAEQLNWGALGVPKAIKGIEALRPDIIHFQYPTVGFGRRLGPQIFATVRPSVVTIHEVSQAHKLRKLALLPFMLRSRHIIFTSPFEREFALRWAPWIAESSSVIPIGSNIKAASSTQQRAVNEIVYFGLIMPRKGLEDLIVLGSLLKTSGLSIRIRIIGSLNPWHKEYFVKLQQRSASLPLIWELDLDAEQVADRLSRAAISYLPYVDGASDRRATLKTMLASGVAVITTKGAHTPPDLESCVLFANAPDDALKMIAHLISNPHEISLLSAKASRYVQQFSWESIAAAHLRVYGEIGVRR